MNRVAYRVEDPVLADRVDRAGTFPECENRWMDAGECKCHPSRAQLLLDVDGFGIDHNARRRFTWGAGGA